MAETSLGSAPMSAIAILVYEERIDDAILDRGFPRTFRRVIRIPSLAEVPMPKAA